MISINILDHTKGTAWRHRIESVKHVYSPSVGSFLTTLQTFRPQTPSRRISCCSSSDSLASWAILIASEGICLYWNYFHNHSVAVVIEQHLAWRCVNFVMMWRATLQFLGATHCDMCDVSVKYDVLCRLLFEEHWRLNSRGELVCWAVSRRKGSLTSNALTP